MAPNYITSRLKCWWEFLSPDTIAVYEKCLSFCKLGERRILAEIPAGTYDIHFRFPYNNMRQNFLGTCMHYVHVTCTYQYKSRHTWSIWLFMFWTEIILELYDAQGNVVLASRVQSSWIWDSRSAPVDFAGTKWYYYFYDQFLSAKGPLTKPCVVKVQNMIWHFSWNSMLLFPCTWIT